MSSKDLTMRDGQGVSNGRTGGRQSVKLVHDQVRETILSGEIPAETVLSQVRLAEQFGVSRIPLREALRLLEREGLIESELNHRVKVTPLSVSDLEQLYAMRIQLEALAARLTIPTLRKEDLDLLQQCLARMGEYATMEDYWGWEVPHRAFHAAIVARSGDRLVSTISQLYDHAERYRRAFMLDTARAWDKSMAEHRDIFEVCKDGDSIAVSERLARHYSVTALSLIAMMAPEHEPVAVRTALRMILRT